MTSGQVISGAGSPGQQVWIGGFQQIDVAAQPAFGLAVRLRHTSAAASSAPRAPSASDSWRPSSHRPARARARPPAFRRVHGCATVSTPNPAATRSAVPNRLARTGIARRPRWSCALSNHSAGPPATKSAAMNFGHLMNETDRFADARQDPSAAQGSEGKRASRGTAGRSRKAMASPSPTCPESKTVALTGVNATPILLLIYYDYGRRHHDSPFPRRRRGLLRVRPWRPCRSLARDWREVLAGAIHRCSSDSASRRTRAFLIDPTDLPFAFRASPQLPAIPGSKSCAAATPRLGTRESPVRSRRCSVSCMAL